MMVAMNPQTWDADVAEIEPGGYLFYDSTRPLPPNAFRDDITVIGMPLTEICNATYTDPRQRQLFKNIIYVGALSVLLDIEPACSRSCSPSSTRARSGCSTNVQGAAPRAATTRKRAPAGARWACGAARRQAVGDRIFVDGNSAAALGCVYGGATVAPGTRSRRRRRWPRPSRSTAPSSASTRRPAAQRYAIVQAEDEIASIGMVIGAGWNGARAFTATSGPGVSLMTEFIGLAYFAEIPVTIIDVQRGGPSTGMPTRTQQADLLPAPTPRTATPSTCCCSRRTRTSASSIRRGASTWPTACRRRCS
jgi:2-oxoglutarate ferredoxin oxidoreductase subunit alpha